MPLNESKNLSLKSVIKTGAQAIVTPNPSKLTTPGSEMSAAQTQYHAPVHSCLEESWQEFSNGCFSLNISLLKTGEHCSSFWFYPLTRAKRTNYSCKPHPIGLLTPMRK